MNSPDSEKLIYVIDIFEMDLQNGRIDMILRKRDFCSTLETITSLFGTSVSTAGVLVRYNCFAFAPSIDFSSETYCQYVAEPNYVAASRPVTILPNFHQNDRR